MGASKQLAAMYLFFTFALHRMVVSGRYVSNRRRGFEPNCAFSGAEWQSVDVGNLLTLASCAVSNAVWTSPVQSFSY
ncbi:hypothetical protein ACO0K7_03805 [Undibacterium sp. Ji67W]|uniref:hypothetical protein n=1 Tax=Undibacterium sp. Ji67W TaxID=3413042 RepID=UPI003BF12830